MEASIAGYKKNPRIIHLFLTRFTNQIIYTHHLYSSFISIFQSQFSKYFNSYTINLTRVGFLFFVQLSFLQLVFEFSKVETMKSASLKTVIKRTQISLRVVRRLIWINGSISGGVLVIPRLIVGFNCHVEELKLMLSNENTQVLPVKECFLEELTLEVRSENYSLPDSIKKMSQLKVLTIKSFTDYPSKLHNLSFIRCLPNLQKIQFEHVSFSSLEPVFALKNLAHLSFVMCEIGDALMTHTTDSPYTLPNLTSLEIDMCCDLKELPSWLCDLVHLRKLSITNCQELDVLPKGLGGLSNLEDLNLHCCTKLQELPDSIGSFHKLRSVDISDCLSISVLPEEIGELCGLRVLKMNGCGGLQELPMSTSKLLKLEEVICDEETSYIWMDFTTDLPNLKINVVEDDRLESFTKIVQ